VETPLSEDPFLVAQQFLCRKQLGVTGGRRTYGPEAWRGKCWDTAFLSQATLSMPFNLLSFCFLFWEIEIKISILPYLIDCCENKLM
jgi:hypothetical protein